MVCGVVTLLHTLSLVWRLALAISDQFGVVSDEDKM